MLAIINGTLYTITDGIISEGTILVDEGKIIAVGTEIDIPVGAQVVDAAGRMVTPGFIDVHTHMGIDEEIHNIVGDDTNEMTDPLTPELRALDGINFRDIGFCDAHNAGITTVMITMGSANVIGGTTTIVKTAGKTAKEMVVVPEAGLKMAFGENPKRVYGEAKKAPSTRMATMAIARQAFIDAQNYLNKKDRDRDLKKEHISWALERKIPVRAHAHRADDIMTAIRLRDEFGLDMVIEHCTDGHLIVDELLEADIPVAIGPSFSNRAKVEMEHVTFKTPGILAKAGLTVAIITDHPCTPIKYLPICAGLAVKEGMSEADAFKALTLNAAKILKLDHRLGSITPGKDADLVIWNDHPFEVKGRPAYVFINGKRVND